MENLSNRRFRDINFSSFIMPWLDISNIIRKIEQAYHSLYLRKYFHYPIDFLIKQIVVMTNRKTAFHNVQSKITEEDLTYLLSPKSTL